MSDFDVVGEDDMDVVGQILQRAMGRPALQMRGGSGGGSSSPAPAQNSASMVFARPSWMGAGAVPQGVSLPREEIDPLPFNAVTLIDTAPSGQLIAFPQRPFRGERLLMSAVFTPKSSEIPVDGGNFVAISPAIFVGAVQVGTSQGDTPISVYAPTAFGVRLSLPHAGQGTRILIPVNSLITLNPGDTLLVTATIMGRAVR